MENLRGSLLMIFAMACFSIEDSFIKAAAKTVPLGEILTLFGLFGTVMFILICKRRRELIFHPAMKSRSMFIRVFFEILGRLFFSLSLILMPLSSLSAILQATPLVVVIGAAIFFGEKVGWRRWTAILIGFIGVLMIIQPGSKDFELSSIFAVLGTLGFAGRDLATRAAPKVLSNTQLGVYGFFILIPTGLFLLAFSNEQAIWPSQIAWLKILGTSIFGFLAYYALTAAMRIGDVSIVTPFRYTRMIFALIIGILIFNEKPDSFTLIGSAIIIIVGIYTLLRSRKETAQKIQ